MKLLIVADGRSPITINWLGYLVNKGHQVHLASTYPCILGDLQVSLTTIPIGFSQAIRPPAQSERVLSKGNNVAGGEKVIKKLTTPKVRTFFRHVLGPLTIPTAARSLNRYINEIKPDLVHAMRIPYEGMLAAKANPDYPLLISVWGNDFTLHANSNPWMAYMTGRAVLRADAIHTDCRRDLNLAYEWGFSNRKPSVVLPSSGGVRLEVFYPEIMDRLSENERIGKKIPSTVINPRGFRAYVRNDIFFRAIPLVLERVPQTQFLCPGMVDEQQAHRWLADLKISHAVDLLPFQTPQQMAALFRRSVVTVSPTIHDGTPNSLLESMACGCFPVAGNLESIREWITSGLNGLLVNPTSIQELADAIVKAITEPELRAKAAEHNTHLISEQADYEKVMRDVEIFYIEVIEAHAEKSG